MTFENSRKSSKYKENNVGGDLKFIISSTSVPSGQPSVVVGLRVCKVYRYRILEQVCTPLKTTDEQPSQQEITNWMHFDFQLK